MAPKRPSEESLTSAPFAFRADGLYPRSRDHSRPRIILVLLTRTDCAIEIPVPIGRFHTDCAFGYKAARRSHMTGEYALRTTRALPPRDGRNGCWAKEFVVASRKSCPARLSSIQFWIRRSRQFQKFRYRQERPFFLQMEIKKEAPTQKGRRPGRRGKKKDTNRYYGEKKRGAVRGAEVGKRAPLL